MGGYLAGYGAGEERREKIWWRVALGVLACAILAGILYFQFRNYSEEKQVKEFLARLKAGDYKSAYSLWGCSDEHPCPQYTFEKFMEDWGPKSPHADAAAAKINKIKSCNAGIIEFIQFPGQSEDVQLWVERKDKVLGFAPWPVCDPRMKVP
jgi:hypothetical protein